MEPTIYARPVNELTRFNFLEFRNYLGEFRTEVDKARVRANLGIPDEYSFNWGYINGTIEDQRDLMNLLAKYKKDTLAESSSNTDRIVGIESQMQVLGNNVINVTNKLTLNTQQLDLMAISVGKVDSYALAVESLKSDVAQNSTDIALLAKMISGDEIDTSIFKQVTKNTSAISSLQTQLASLPTLTQYSVMSDAITNISLRVTNIEQNGAGSSDLQAQINVLLAQVQVLQDALGSNELSHISLNVTSDTLQDLTINASDINITVTANYTKIEPVNITSECTVVTSNLTVATWNKDNDDHGFIHIIGAGSTTFTFSFRGKSVTLNIRVVADELPEDTTVYQYVGYAADYTQIVGNANFLTLSVAKTWTKDNSPYILSPVMGFWVVTTLNIATFGGSIGNYNLTELQQGQIEYRGKLYTIYMAGPVTNTDGTFTLTIN